MRLDDDRAQLNDRVSSATADALPKTKLSPADTMKGSDPHLRDRTFVGMLEREKRLRGWRQRETLRQRAKKARIDGLLLLR